MYHGENMLRIKNLYKKFVSNKVDVIAVKDVSFNIEKGKFYTLLGPSGCGKSTILRCVAGLEVPESGEIWIGNQLVFSAKEGISVATYKRTIGMMFQSYAIWPHMNVFDNVAFPLRQTKKRFKKAKIKEKVLEILKLVKMEGFESRLAPQLSGGQQQRVALARALIREPLLLLLDEPLSNLDAQLREEMRVEIKELVKKLDITSLYVTHDQLEAVSMSDEIAVLYNGEIIETGGPKKIYTKPMKKFVAEFTRAMELFDGVTKNNSLKDGLAPINTSHGTIMCYTANNIGTDKRVTIAIRPSEIEILQEKPTDMTNVLKAEVVKMIFLGDSICYSFKIDERIVNINLSIDNSLKIGSKVFLHIPPSKCHLIIDK